MDKPQASAAPSEGSPAADTFAVTAPAISLPKGGGAIHGIGEKFASNPVTGTGTFSVPIYASPGRSGFSPQLSLTYDSGNGNGPVGFGWHVGLPAITRKTDKGLPRYDDATDSDIFVLSGAEDLVPELAEAAGQWTRIEEVRPLYGMAYHVRRYRPRIESLFARIERWSSTTDASDVFWRAVSRDNVTTWYGRTRESRIADPADPSRIFSWLLCETYDDRGNASAYRYLAESSERVAVGSAHERNRTDQSRSANRYIDRIQYGNRTPYFPDLNADAAVAVPADWCFELVFDYGNHNRDVPLPVEPGIIWPCRDDPFSTYRPGFEVRTYRLCRRVLMFHHFPVDTDPAVGHDCLVRSTDLVYSQDIDPADPSNPVYSFLKTVTQTGYRRAGAGYVSRSLPPLEFGYSEARIDETLQVGDPGILANLPQGIDGTRFQWVDLDGAGVSGILTEQAGAWFYKRNLSPAGGAPGAPAPPLRFAELELLGRMPSLAALGHSKQQLLDLAGEGQLDLVDFGGPTPGYFERNDEFSTPGWEPFRPFTTLPNLDWNDPNLKFVDLDGDGHADILISEDDAFVWHASLAEAGFGPARRARKAIDEEHGPRVVFADGTESVFLADMTGDGLTDIVRIRRGEVCYWPNIGYGRFGAKVTMEGGPLFEPADLFDGRRLRLTDIDGSGTSDLIYFSSRGAQAYFNQSGNGWSDLHQLAAFPEVDNASIAMPLDLLGTGTACLVWSSTLPSATRRPLRYVNLMADGKPHLLTSVINNLGAETYVEYAPSTRFYIADELAGRPWITRLPFPVHVVERVTTYDHVSRNRFVSRYAYHHGYFDGVEREFRGFGMVEQWDTEEIASVGTAGAPPPSTNLDAPSYVPPVLTCTWFHTGVYLGRERVSNYFAGHLDAGGPGEYYRPPGLTRAQLDALLLDDTPLPAGLDADEEREACRALKGSMLRQEIYALDGTDREPHPYTVTEQNFTVVRLQPHQDGQFGVFLTHSREALSFHYERNPADPRITHALTLEVDRFGNTRRTLAVAYGRQMADPDLAPDDQARQSAIKMTYTETDVTNDVDLADVHRNPLVSEVRTYEVTGFTPAGLISFDAWTAGDYALPNGLPTIQYETTPDPLQQQKRLIECVSTRYRRDDLTGLLGKDALEAHAITGEAYRLAFTPGLLAAVFQRQLAGGPVENLIPDPGTTLGGTASDEGGYVDLAGDGRWWIPSGTTFYSPNADPVNPAATAAAELAEARTHFYVPRKVVDPFLQATTVVYDGDDLFAEQSTDPVDNTVASKHDYRVLAVREVTDPNGNRTEAVFDLLGMMAGTARRGKVGENLGDRLDGFNADLPQPVLDAFFAAGDPTAAAIAALVDASTRVLYDVDRFWRTRLANPSDPTKWLPVCGATVTRETHFFDLLAGQATAVQLLFTYSDGMGRDIQKKTKVERGPVVPGGPATDPRWVCSGWTIYNNKGKPVRQFEPLFSATHEFEFAPESGVSPVLFYDPVGRLIATLHPDHSWEKVRFDGWHQETWDVGDTVAITDPKSDPDVGSCFARLPDAWYLPTWYSMRIAGTRGPEAKAAAVKSAVYAGTPTRAYFDALARVCVTVAHNRFKRTGLPATDEFYRTQVSVDIEGNTVDVTDARGLQVMAYRYDMLGNRIRQDSVVAGARWMLNDILAKSIRAWDSRSQNFRNAYDKLRRPVQSYVLGPGRGEFLAVETIYGETRANPEIGNLRTRAVELHDQAGAVVSDQYDFKGNLVRNRRQLATEFQQALDWSAAVALDPAVYESRTRYDALNRPVELDAPDGTQIRPSYGASSRLQQLETNLRGVAAITTFIQGIEYDAKGQRLQIDYGSGASTAYAYDPETFRLAHVTTSRTGFPPDAAVVQDLAWTYEVAGHISRIRDNAQQTIFFRNRRVDPTNDYTYDATGRLIEALGREHLSLVAGAPSAPYPSDPYDALNRRLAQPGDGNAMGTYLEQYFHDSVGNLLATRHQGLGPASPGWRRCYQYALNSNRLLSTTNPALPHDPTLPCTTPYAAVAAYTDTYDYDAHGSMTRMPHLPVMQWDYRDNLAATTRQVVNEGGAETTYYRYDASGKRTRKVTALADGNVKDERIYLGSFEVYQRGGVGPLTRETLHIMDDHQRIAMVETRTDLPVADQLIRYQHANHFGSTLLELDAVGDIISYEEYTPYGSTSYQAVRSQTETPKRYRYTVAERDEENGLTYHATRYYAPWLGRWTAADPSGLDDGPNVYQYVSGDPITLKDPSGRAGQGQSSVLGDLILYADSVLNRALVGANVQKDHAISQAIIKDILGPLEKLYKPGRDLTTVVETGAASGSTAARWHTVKSTLERAVQTTVKDLLAADAKAIEAGLEAKGLSLGESVVEPVVGILKQASGAATLSREQYLSMLSQLGNLHATTTPEQAGRLAALIESGDAAKLAKTVDAMASSTKGAAKWLKVLRGIANSENAAAATARLAPVAAKLAGAAKVLAPAVRALAPVARLAGRIAGPLGIGVAAVQFATAKNTEQKVDAGITAVSAGLMMSKHPVAMAAGAGLAAGQLIDSTLHVSDYSSKAGVAVYEKLKEAGLNDTASFVIGGVASVVAIPSAIGYAAAAKVASWFN